MTSKKEVYVHSNFQRCIQNVREIARIPVSFPTRPLANRNVFFPPIALRAELSY